MIDSFYLPHSVVIIPSPPILVAAARSGNPQPIPVELVCWIQVQIYVGFLIMGFCLFCTAIGKTQYSHSVTSAFNCLRYFPKVHIGRYDNKNKIYHISSSYCVLVTLCLLSFYQNNNSLSLLLLISDSVSHNRLNKYLLN